MRLDITLKQENGLLGGPHHVEFNIVFKNAHYDISIDQLCIRKITIETMDGNFDDLKYLYYSMEELIMLFDGRFYSVYEANNGQDITEKWHEDTLPSYTSADFMMRSDNRLVMWANVLNGALLEKWLSLKENIDLVHKMILYCLSSVGMPKDMQCAFMIEAMKGLAGLIHKQDNTFAPELFVKKDVNLKAAILAVIDRYGNDIFSKEYDRNRDKFAQALINTRNRIAHIRDYAERLVLTGEVNVWYIVKLSLLYRITMFELLGISRTEYNSALYNFIQKIDDNSEIKRFIRSLPQSHHPVPDPELVKDIYSLLYSFVYSVAVYKVLYSRRERFREMTEEQSQIWTSISDNSIQMAVIDWCKVFGSYDERTHYKKINTQYIECFERAIIAGKGINLVDYTKSMKTFRDTFIAHRDQKKKRKPIPYLNKALEICYLYERMVICGEPGMFPYDLELFYMKSIDDINTYLDTLDVFK